MERLEKVILENLRSRPQEECLWWENGWMTSLDLLSVVEKNVQVLK